MSDEKKQQCLTCIFSASDATLWFWLRVLVVLFVVGSAVFLYLYPGWSVDDSGGPAAVVSFERRAERALSSVELKLHAARMAALDETVLLAMRELALLPLSSAPAYVTGPIRRDGTPLLEQLLRQLGRLNALLSRMLLDEFAVLQSEYLAGELAVMKMIARSQQKLEGNGDDDDTDSDEATSDDDGKTPLQLRKENAGKPWWPAVAPSDDKEDDDRRSSGVDKAVATAVFSQRSRHLVQQRALRLFNGLLHEQFCADQASEHGQEAVDSQRQLARLYGETTHSSAPLPAQLRHTDAGQLFFVSPVEANASEVVWLGLLMRNLALRHDNKLLFEVHASVQAFWPGDDGGRQHVRQLDELVAKAHGTATQIQVLCQELSLSKWRRAAHQQQQHRHSGPGHLSSRWRLAIVVPFRDREQHLAVFRHSMQQHDFSADFDERHLFVVEQTADFLFNRGKLLNVGFDVASQRGYTHFLFHDVDMIPNASTAYRPLKAAGTPPPVHAATCVQQFDYKLPYDAYAGGVLLMSADQYRTINGFSNRFWGWGGEDDDAYQRIAAHWSDGPHRYTPACRFGLFTSQGHKKADSPGTCRNRILADAPAIFGDLDGASSLHYAVDSVVELDDFETKIVAVI